MRFLQTAYQLTNSSACDCPEECSSLWYRNEITTGAYPNPVSEYPISIVNRWKDKNETSFKEYAKKNFAKLNVYFKSTTGIAYVMDMRTTWADFICMLILNFCLHDLIFNFY